MLQADEGEDVAAATTTYLAYEHSVVLDYVGKGRYLQMAVSKSILDLYVSKFRKFTTKTLSNMAAEGRSLTFLKWSRDQGCVWDDSVFLSSAKGGRIKLMRWMLSAEVLRVSKDGRACAAAAGGGHKEAIKWLRCCGFSWDASTCTAAGSGGHLGVLLWAHFDCFCPWDSLEVCKEAARHHHLHILVEMHDRGMQPTSSEVCAVAAYGGNLAILEWLRERQYPWDTRVCRAAIERGNLDILKYAIDNNCPFSLNEGMDYTLDSPLHTAARKGHANIAAFLLEKCGGNPTIINLINWEGRTALSLGSETGSLALVELLVHAGANLEAATPEGRTPLYYAISKNRVGVIKYLIGAGAKLDFPFSHSYREDFNGYSLLHVASMNNYPEAAKILIHHGVDLECRARNTYTPLRAAIAGNCLKTVRVLIDSGASTSAVGLDDRSSPLHWAIGKRETLGTSAANVTKSDDNGEGAALEDNLKLIRTLINSGVDVNLADASGDAPIHKAVWIGALEVIDILILAGADLNVARRRCDTPLVMAASRNNLKVAQRLVQAGADVNLSVMDADRACISEIGLLEDKLKSLNIRTTHFNLNDKVNHTNPLAVATLLGHVDIVKYLMSVGASLEAAGGAHALLVRTVAAGSLEVIEALGLDVNMKDDQRITLLHVLVRNGRRKAVETAIKAGADVSITDKHGMTPLDIAKKIGHSEIVSILVAAASVDIAYGMNALTISEDKGHMHAGIPSTRMPFSVPEISGNSCLFSIGLGAPACSKRGEKRSVKKKR